MEEKNVLYRRWLNHPVEDNKEIYRIKRDVSSVKESGEEESLGLMGYVLLIFKMMCMVDSRSVIWY